MESKKDEIKISKDYMKYVKRAYCWIHDTLILFGLIFAFLIFGGASLFGYYFYFDIIALELTEISQKSEKQQVKSENSRR